MREPGHTTLAGRHEASRREVEPGRPHATLEVFEPGAQDRSVPGVLDGGDSVRLEKGQDDVTPFQPGEQPGGIRVAAANLAELGGEEPPIPTRFDDASRLITDQSHERRVDTGFEALDTIQGEPDRDQHPGDENPPARNPRADLPSPRHEQARHEHADADERRGEEQLCEHGRHGSHRTHQQVVHGIEEPQVHVEVERPAQGGPRRRLADLQHEHGDARGRGHTCADDCRSPTGKVGEDADQHAGLHGDPRSPSAPEQDEVGKEEQSIDNDQGGRQPQQP